MVSFDVTSRFTSIPKELAVQLRDDTNIDLKNEQLADVMKLCMKTFFTFQGQPYEQIKGIPMGSPISGYIAEIVLQKLKNHHFGYATSTTPSPLSRAADKVSSRPTWTPYSGVRI